MVDTHCHINILVKGFSKKEIFSDPLTTHDLEQCSMIIQEAFNQGVTTIINVGTNASESQQCVQIAERFNHCYATLGLHPNDTTQEWPKTIQLFKNLLINAQHKKIVGIGECGIDKHYPNFNLKLQEAAFHAQIELALEHNKALVIHSRDADAETYHVLKAYQHEKNFKGTIHCFSSNLDYAYKYIELGFMLGFGGTLTYPKNDMLRTVATTMPLEKIILETDTPYLAPQAVRGTKNVPANIALIAQFLATIRKTDLKTIASVTTENAYKLFDIQG